MILGGGLFIEWSISIYDVIYYLGLENNNNIRELSYFQGLQYFSISMVARCTVYVYCVMLRLLLSVIIKLLSAFLSHLKFFFRKPKYIFISVETQNYCPVSFTNALKLNISVLGCRWPGWK